MSRLSSYLIALMAAVVLALVPALTPAAEAAPGAPAKSLKALGSVKPKILGEPVVGSTLTAKVGTWTAGTKFSYQWYVDGKAIRTGTAKTLKLTKSREGKKITVTVTGKKSGYATTSRTSSASTKVAKVSTPTIKGSAKVNSKLNAKPGSWTKGTKFTYRWYLNGKAVKGGTNKTLKMTPSRVGMKASVKVTGKLKGHTTVSRTSKATAAISYPTRTTPSSRTSCPSWAPIKGNQPSMIYHLRGQKMYDRTHPEECFRTESAAKKAGYRKSLI